MRRSTAVAIGLTAGAALLFGAKAGTRPPPDLGAVVAGPPDGRAGGPGAPGGSARPGSHPPSRGPGATPAAPPGAPAATQAPAAGADAAPPPPAVGGSGLRTGTFTGAVVSHKYGTLRVTITVSNGRITNASASYQTSLRLSAQINAEALPKLRLEALAAQSADIDTVSGATYTSDAYRSSLQSALDRARG